MPPFGFALWNWFANNRYAQIAGAILAALLLLRWKEEVDEARGARRANARAEKRAVKVADKIITKMEEQSDDRIEQARKAADAVPDDVTSGSLRDDTAGFLFGDEKRD